MLSRFEAGVFFNAGQGEGATQELSSCQLQDCEVGELTDVILLVQTNYNNYSDVLAVGCFFMTSLAAGGRLPMECRRPQFFCNV